MFYKNPDGTSDNKVRAIIDWQVINEGRGFFIKIFVEKNSIFQEI
jgi:hypothetical protein